MADDSRAGRSRRRRYFKRKGERPQGAEGEARERPAAAAGPADENRSDGAREPRADFRTPHEDSAFGGGGGSRSRNLRKRRRSRARRNDAPATGAPGVPVERDVEYVPPQQVYIYEHLVRPSAGSYEFRSESFSKAGRTLEDYSVDLEHIFNPPPREPVGQIIARVFAEFEAADAIEAERAGRMLPLEGDETATPLGGASALAAGSEPTPLSDRWSAAGADPDAFVPGDVAPDAQLLDPVAQGEPWTGRDPLMAAAEEAAEESIERAEFEERPPDD